MRVGAKLPNSGALPVDIGHSAHGGRLEASGFASVWVSDHVVMPATVTSRYPYAADGAATWATNDPWYDSIVALAMAAAVTDHAELGTAVLVLPQRQPVILAKQIASLDRLAGGRVVLGVGAGWLAEEFAALATPFDSRGARTDEWIDCCGRAGPEGRTASTAPTTSCRPTSCASRRPLARSRSSSAGRRGRRCDEHASAATAGSASNRPTPSTSPPSSLPSPNSTVSAARCCGSSARPSSGPPSPRRSRASPPPGSPTSSSTSTGTATSPPRPPFLLDAAAWPPGHSVSA